MFFAIGLFFWGCSPSNTSNTLLPDSETPLPTLSNTPHPRPTFTLISELTVTPLSLLERKKMLQGLYENNGGCQIPCYWGIVPGETLWQSASVFLSSLGEITGPGGTTNVPNYGVFFKGSGNPFESIMPIFWVENGLVKVVGINSGWVSQDFDYRLSGLLQSLGLPDEIWIRPIAESLDGQPYYNLKLFYPSKGILVGMLGNAEQDGQYLSVCPQNIFSRSPYPPTLLLWNPKEQVSFDGNFGKQLVDDDLGIIIDEYRLLQDVSPNGLTNAQFYDIYSDPDTEICIKVSPVR